MDIGRETVATHRSWSLLMLLGLAAIAAVTVAGAYQLLEVRVDESFTLEENPSAVLLAALVLISVAGVLLLTKTVSDASSWYAAGGVALIAAGVWVRHTSREVVYGSDRSQLLAQPDGSPLWLLLVALGGLSLLGSAILSTSSLRAEGSSKKVVATAGLAIVGIGILVVAIQMNEVVATRFPNVGS